MFSIVLFFVHSFGLLNLKKVAGEEQAAPHRFEPQVALVCDLKNPKEQYFNQYLSESGKWVTDVDTKAKCSKNKVDILKYCQKVYPDKGITNIVEASSPQKISNWCHIGQEKCLGGSQWVKPYRCLAEPFQSDALLVPDRCQFLHMHNESVCHEYQRWNGTAAAACARHGMVLKSFAMLIPCGIDVFRGVEFVCCPQPIESRKNSRDLDNRIEDSDDKYEDDYNDEDDDEDEDDDDDDDDEDDEDDDDDDDDDDDGEASDSKEDGDEWDTKSKKGERVTSDPYFQQFDPKNEHALFKAAEQKQEKRQHERITKLMKEWSELEERYQELRETGVHGAESFKKKMTQQFEKKVSALEEEGAAERRQLQSVHQQRVLAHINLMKKDAMTCYTRALNEEGRNTHRIQKCLQQLLRALQKDRTHTLSHFKHLLTSDFPQADRQRDLTADHLSDVDRMVNQSLTMLDRYPRLAAKLVPAMEKFLNELRLQEPSVPSRTVTAHSSAQELVAAMHREYAAKYYARMKEKMHRGGRRRQQQQQQTSSPSATSPSVATTTTTTTTTTATVGNNSTASAPAVATITAATAIPGAPASRSSPITFNSSSAHPVRQHEIPVAHVQSHSLVHSQQGPLYLDSGHFFGAYPLVGGSHQSRSVYFTLTFVGLALVALVIVGAVVLRRRSLRSPYRQGFVEVDQAASPEERHVNQMQINGYENPTYKYFEAQEA